MDAVDCSEIKNLCLSADTVRGVRRPLVTARVSNTGTTSARGKEPQTKKKEKTVQQKMGRDV